jgi:hypothetical protein
MGDSRLGIGSRIEHPKFGKGVIVDTDAEFYTIWFKDGNSTRGIARDFEALQVLEKTESAEPSITLDDIKKAVRDVVDEKTAIGEIVQFASKWIGGTLVLKAGSPELQPKEIPIDVFFHKIVMVRDRLRVLEQNINSHKVLTDEEKVDLQQYITRIYGSLTTFNVMFKDPNQQFKGASGEK